MDDSQGVFFGRSGALPAATCTLSLHDALPICGIAVQLSSEVTMSTVPPVRPGPTGRSEEHTSELQSHVNFVCRLLLEKKKCGSVSASRTASGRPVIVVLAVQVLMGRENG